MTLAFHYAARSDVGLLRSVNQDSGYAGPHLLLLADGMGGPAGGDVASSVAIAHLAPLDGESHAGDMLALLRSAVADAHTELRQRAARDRQLHGLGTTLIAAMRSGKRLAMAHIGDSRAYLVRDGVVSRLTTDHTYVQHLVDLGQLTEEEAESHPHRSVILRVLGDHDLGVELDESVRELAKGDRFLLCSDGVSSYVSAEAVEDTLLTVADPGDCADVLVDLALRAGGPDNITAVVADVVELDELPDGAAPATIPQIVGAAAVRWREPTRGGTGAAARAAALLGPVDGVASSGASGGGAGSGRDGDEAGSDPADGDGELDDLDGPDGEGDADGTGRSGRTRRRRRVVWAGVLAVVLLLLGGGGAGGYRWTQTQHFVAASGEFVAIYQGIPVVLGPVSLNHPVQTTDIRVADLPAFARDRVEAGITPADATLSAAQDVVDSLRADAEGTGGTGGTGATASPTASPTPSPTPTRTSRATPSGTPSSTASATPTSTPASQASP